MPAKPKFSDGERVLCFHGPLMYEAKTTKSSVKEKNIKYLVHYNGWNKSWDEWVPESRVLKYGDAALQKQKELKKAHEAKTKAQRAAAKSKKLAEKEKEEAEAKKDTKERASTPVTDKRKSAKGKDKTKEKEKNDRDDDDKASEDGSVTLSRKRSRATRDKDKDKEKDKEIIEPESKKEKKEKEEKKDDDDQPKKKRIKADVAVESEEAYVTKIEVKVRLPDDLKPWLVDDYDLINRQKQLVCVPCTVSVDSILDDFVKSKVNKPNFLQKDAVLEVSQGIRDYFNVMLGTQLLYKFERPQYAEILVNHPDKPMSQLYGATHLLRLFVRIGGMLAYTSLDDKTMQLLLTHLHDFLKYLTRSAGTYLHTSDYILAPPEYHRKAL